MFGIGHMDGSGEDNPPVESLSDLYDELSTSGIVDGSVAVIHDDSGWCMSAYRDGGVVFEHLASMGTQRHIESVPKERVLELWRRLINGDIEGLLSEPWKLGYVDVAERHAARPRVREEPSTRLLPLHVSPGGDLDSARLYRLRDGRFQIVQAGPMRMLIYGPDHVLVHQELASLLRGLQLEGVQLVPAVVYDRPTGQMRSDYCELLIDPAITVEDNIEQLDVSVLRMWRCRLEKVQHVFVSPCLRDRLLAGGFTMLEFSPGFSQFGEIA